MMTFSDLAAVPPDPPAPFTDQLRLAVANAGADLRDVQIAARHADPRTTMRYDRARNNLDRHPNYILAAYMASGTATLSAARRRGVWHALTTARCASTPDLPGVVFTSDYSRPGFLRVGFLPITRFTLWAVAA